MRTYPKIETLYDRDEKFKVNVGKFRRPEYNIIHSWVLTEKIDGTNIRLTWHLKDYYAEIKGRSDNAEIPTHLNEYLESLIGTLGAKPFEIMEQHGIETYTLFGEGYGPKIQSGGRYRDTPGFILFDVLVNNKIWLGEEAVTKTANDLGIDRVPILLDNASIGDAIRLCGGIADVFGGPFISTISKDREYIAEGVVAKTIVPLYDNRGDRVMWKLKSRDF